MPFQPYSSTDLFNDACLSTIQSSTITAVPFFATANILEVVEAPPVEELARTPEEQVVVHSLAVGVAVRTPAVKVAVHILAVEFAVHNLELVAAVRNLAEEAAVRTLVVEVAVHSLPGQVVVHILAVVFAVTGTVADHIHWEHRIGPKELRTVLGAARHTFDHLEDGTPAHPAYRMMSRLHP